MKKIEYLYTFLLLIIVFNYFYPLELHQTAMPFYIYFIFLIYLSNRIELVYLNKKIDIQSFPLIAYSLLAFFLILTSLTGVYISASRDHLLYIFAFIIIFAFIKYITLDERKIWRGLHFLLLVSSIICIYSVLQYITDFFSLAERIKEIEFLSLQEKEIIALRLAQKRVYGFFAFPTTLAAFLTMIIPINIGAMVKSKSIFRKTLLFLLLILHLATLFLTKSYGGAVTLIAVILVIAAIIFIKTKKPGKKKLILAGTALLLLIALAVVTGIIRGGLFHFDDPSNPIMLRLANWNAALKMIGDYSFLGVGLGNYGTVFPQYYLPNAQPSQYAHNSYLQVFAEVGVIGGILMLLFVTNWLVKIIKQGFSTNLVCESNRIMYYSLLSSFTAFLVNNGFEINIYYPSLGFTGILLGAFLHKSAFQCKNTNEGALYLPTPAKKKSILTLREKSAVAVLIIFWFAITILVSQRFIGLLLYHSAGLKYTAYELNAAERDINSARFLDPLDSRYYYLNSLIAFELYKTVGDKEYLSDALWNAEIAVQLNPNTPYLHANYSSMLFYKGRIWDSLFQLKWADYLIPYVNKYRREVELFQNTLFNVKTEKR